MLLKSGVYHGLATHDEKIIATMKQFAATEKIPPTEYEFQMLYGVRRDLQEQLVREGYGLRVYIPFGTEWYPYFMRRLAERPANVFFIAKNMLGGRGGTSFVLSSRAKRAPALARLGIERSLSNRL